MTKPRLDPMEEAISGPDFISGSTEIKATPEQKSLVWRLTAWAILKLKRLVK